MNVTALEIAKLSLAPGDVLVVMTHLHITPQQRDAIISGVSAKVPAGTPVMVLGSGLTLAKINKADLPA